MRQLYLVNESGTSFFFDYRSSALISNVSDLGFSRNNTYLNFENDYVLVDSKVAQASITFKVVFLKGYEGYKEFARFIALSNELRLFYKVDENTKYCYVSFKSISKTELESNCIQSSVVLDKLSLWLVNESHTIIASEGSGGKKFPFSYPTTYASSFVGSVNISNDSAIKVPLTIEINGAINNPRVDVFKDGVMISTLRLILFSDNAKVVVNAIYSNQSMTKEENGIITNIYPLQDFTCDNFLFLDKGNYVIRFTPGVNANTTCKVTLLKSYEGQ